MSFFKKLGSGIQQINTGIERTKSKFNEFQEKQQKRAMERDEMEYSRLKKQESILKEREKISNLRNRVQTLRAKVNPPSQSIFGSGGFGLGSGGFSPSGFGQVRSKKPSRYNYVALYGDTGKKEFQNLSDAKAFARNKANSTGKKIEIDKFTVSGSFSQSSHSIIKPTKKRK